MFNASVKKYGPRDDEWDEDFQTREQAVAFIRKASGYGYSNPTINGVRVNQQTGEAI